MVNVGGNSPSSVGWASRLRQDGGNGETTVELSILMEAFGKHLVIEPYLAAVVLGGGLVAVFELAAKRQAMLPAVINGQCHLAFARDERAW